MSTLNGTTRAAALDPAFNAGVSWYTIEAALVQSITAWHRRAVSYGPIPAKPTTLCDIFPTCDACPLALTDNNTRPVVCCAEYEIAWAARGTSHATLAARRMRDRLWMLLEFLRHGEVKR